MSWPLASPAQSCVFFFTSRSARFHHQAAFLRRSPVVPKVLYTVCLSPLYSDDNLAGHKFVGSCFLSPELLTFLLCLLELCWTFFFFLSLLLLPSLTPPRPSVNQNFSFQRNVSSLKPSHTLQLRELLLERPTTAMRLWCEPRYFWSVNHASLFSFIEIIDDLANLVENTDEKLRTETRRVNLVDRKSTSYGMIMVILLLLVAIVVVAVWPTY